MDELKIDTLRFKKSWLITAFLNFIIAASFALLLRLASVFDLSWMDYIHVRHAHSHIAMLGWLFLIVYQLIWHRFLPKDVQSKPFYNRLFWIIQITVLGMAISFPIQGYGFFSISFTTLHLFCSYLFVYFVWKDLPAHKSYSLTLLKTSMFWMVLSTVGLWALSIVMASGERGPLYYATIQFFLHFQFNGWFTFISLALLFRELELRGIEIKSGVFRPFFALLVISCVLTFALSVAWSTPLPILFVLNGAGVIIQFTALVYFLVIISKVWRQFVSNSTMLSKAFYLIAIASFIVKIVIQCVVVVPEVAVISYTIRLFVVGFIHLTMLGSITCFIIGLLIDRYSEYFCTKLAKIGLAIFLASFFASEVILFVQGIFLWATIGFFETYYEMILMASIIMVFGLIISVLPLLGSKN